MNMNEREKLTSELGIEAWRLKTESKPTHMKLARLVTLVSNMKKSPWLLSRCKESASHIQALIDLLRPEDKITVAVKLESPPSLTNVSRFLVVVSTGSNHVVQESAVLGIDVIEDAGTVGLVLPICDDMDIQMDGDGGFNICTAKDKHSFHPVSVQAMWSALQSLVKAVYYARYHHQNLERSSHGWLPSYSLRSPPECIFEWNRIIDSDFSSLSQGNESTEDIKLKLAIKRKLRDIMTNETDIDLENVTSKYLREKLEEALKVNLMACKRFVDEEMVVVMRQMDSPSQILDYLYLGSEWNASNLEELQQNRVGYILNVTREIDNFFPGMFKYCNVRVDDVPETQLIRHWSSTNKFIAEAKKSNSRVLVHCKMGVSRSASTVIAYVMKECGKPFIEAYQHVKQKRTCVKPNVGFMDQLSMYEGILGASKHRHNKLFRSRSAETLDKDMPAEDDRPGKRSKKDDETEAKNESKTPDFDSTDLTPVSEVSSSDSDAKEPKTRPATFSIDSIEAFSPGTIPVIAGLREGSLQDVAQSEQTELVDMMEQDEEVLCDRLDSGSMRNEVGLLPDVLLNDPGLSVTSMLRKLSVRADGTEGDLSGLPGRIFHPSQSERKPEEDASLNKGSIRRRSSSWPQRCKDRLRLAVKAEKSILRPNAGRHRKLRGRRSNTIAVDD